MIPKTSEEEKPLFAIVDDNDELLASIDVAIFGYQAMYLTRVRFNFKQSQTKVLLVDECLVGGYLQAKLGIPKTHQILLRLEPFSKIDKKELIVFISDQLGIEVRDIISGTSELYIQIKNGGYIPFSLLGDGTKVYLTYYYALSLQNSYILLEEPENHLHPSLMDRCIELMVESSKNNQIFITTHNIEFLQKILKTATERGANLKVFAFRDLIDGIPEIDVYDLEEADSALNKIGVDLR